VENLIFRHSKKMSKRTAATLQEDDTDESSEDEVFQKPLKKRKGIHFY